MSEGGKDGCLNSSRESECTLLLPFVLFRPSESGDAHPHGEDDLLYSFRWWRILRLSSRHTPYMHPEMFHLLSGHPLAQSRRRIELAIIPKYHSPRQSAFPPPILKSLADLKDTWKDPMRFRHTPWDAVGFIMFMIGGLENIWFVSVKGAGGMYNPVGPLKFEQS